MAGAGNNSTSDSVAVAIDLFVSVFGMIVIVFGTVGNLLTLITVVFYHSLRVSTRLMFFCLALSDSCAIFSAAIRYWQAAALKHDLRNDNAFACQVHTFAVYMAFSMSNWLLCLIATERFCLTVIPLKSVGFKNLKVIIVLIVALTALSALKNGPLLGRSYRDGKCLAVFAIDIHVFTWLDMVFGNAIPYAYLIAITTAIVLKIYFQRKKVKPVGDNNRAIQSGQKENNRILSATLMLLGVSIYQFVVGTPGFLFNALMDTNMLTHMNPVITSAIYRILLVFSASNNAVNFYLYMLTTRGFRRAFVMLCLKAIGRKGQDPSGVSMEATHVGRG